MAKTTKKPRKTFEQTQKEYEEKVINALNKNPDIYQFCDITLVVPLSRATLYNYGLDKIDTIKRKLEDNKINFKRILRNDMRRTQNPTCLIALYKLLGTQEERDALNNAKVDVSGNVEVSTQNMFLQHLRELGTNAN